MSKFKWVKASFGVSLATLVERMRKARFDPHEDDAEGFRIEQKKLGYLSGQFIERETLLERISLPTGEEYEERRTRVSVTDFMITEGQSLNMLLKNPPRRSLPFFNALSEITTFKFSSEALDIDIFQWISRLEQQFGNTKVTFVDCNQVQISPSVVGRFAFRGTEDVREEVARVIRKGTPSVESARCEIAYDGGVTTLELFRTGAARFEGDGRDFLTRVGLALAEVA